MCSKIRKLMLISFFLNILFQEDHFYFQKSYQLESTLSTPLFALSSNQRHVKIYYICYVIRIAWNSHKFPARYFIENKSIKRVVSLRCSPKIHVKLQDIEPPKDKDLSAFLQDSCRSMTIKKDLVPERSLLFHFLINLMFQKRPQSAMDFLSSRVRFLSAILFLDEFAKTS